MSNEAEKTNGQVLMVFVAGIVVTAVAMAVAVFIAGQRPVVVLVNPAPIMQASLVGGGQAPGTGQSVQAEAPAPEVVVTQVQTLPALKDLFNPLWDKAASLDVPLQPQTLAKPILETGTIRSMTVQALRDNSRLAWRISWEAPRPSSNVDADRFADGVALQFPLEPGTSFMMGAKGKPVHILHWKALWQKDIDEGFQDVHSVHPNVWSDFYWFTTGEHPFPMASAFKDPAARQFHPALAAGNPMADTNRDRPVEELVAEGFGTATTIPSTNSGAHGVWKDGRWTVVIDRPLSPGDRLSAALESGKADSIAFAVWDGSAGNSGGRKHWANWIPLKVKP
jgi:hypothetical protein